MFFYAVLLLLFSLPWSVYWYSLLLLSKRSSNILIDHFTNESCRLTGDYFNHFLNLPSFPAYLLTWIERRLLPSVYVSFLFMCVLPTRLVLFLLIWFFEFRLCTNYHCHSRTSAFTNTSTIFLSSVARVFFLPRPVQHTHTHTHANTYRQPAQLDQLILLFEFSLSLPPPSSSLIINARVSTFCADTLIVIKTEFCHTGLAQS